MGFFNWISNEATYLGKKARQVGQLGYKGLKGFNYLGTKVSQFAHSKGVQDLLHKVEDSGIPYVSQIASGAEKVISTGDDILKTTEGIQSGLGGVLGIKNDRSRDEPGMTKKPLGNQIPPQQPARRALPTPPTIQKVRPVQTAQPTGYNPVTSSEGKTSATVLANLL